MGISAEEESYYQEAIKDIDYRLKVANYYRAVIDADLFQTDAIEAVVVAERIRAIARDELMALMGDKGAVRVALDPTEIKALKLLAQRVLNPDAPTTTPAAAPSPPPTPQAPPVARATPKPIEIPPIAVKPVQQRLAVAQAAPPAVTPSPAPLAATTSGPPKIPDSLKRKIKKTDSDPIVDGAREPLELEGNVGTATLASVAAEVPLVGGRRRRVLTTETGKTVEQDLTPQQISAAALPMPSKTQMQMVTHQQSSNTADRIARGGVSSRLTTRLGASIMDIGQ